MSDIPSLVCDPLPAIGLDRQVFQVVEPFDVFGVNAMGGLVEGFRWVDELFCPGVILIHRESRWFTGKVVTRHKYNEAIGEARLHLRAFGSIREISPADAMEWFDANFKRLPEQAAELFRRSAASAPADSIEAPAASRPKRKAASGKLNDEPIPVKATAAAYALSKEGKPVSLRAVCERAGIDRANLKRNHPEAVATIQAMSQPDRAPKRGVRDLRTGDVDGWDSDADD